MGFFPTSVLLQSKPPARLAPNCGACGLYRGCQRPKWEYSGKGRRRVLIIGEAPTEEEDRSGRQMTGTAGELLRSTLRRFEVDLDKDCWKTNAIICHPPKSRTPTPLEVDYCLPNLRNTIKATSPDIIIPLGDVAVRALIGAEIDDVGGVARWVGWRIPSQKHNAWVCPTWHPAHIIHRERDTVLRLWWERHLEAAFECTGKPWPDGPPDYAKDIEVFKNPHHAVPVLEEFLERGGPIAFDYETNCLKPDNPKAAIYSCSVCWRGRRTIAFPWHRTTRAAMLAIIRSKMPKIAANKKFEERWTLKEFGHGVRNWVWCTMLAAHTLDARKEINSIKFQSYVRFGVPTYNAHIEPYFEGKHGNSLNRIHEIDLHDLLLYNGLDSLLEYKVAVVQAKELGVSLK